LICDGGSCIEPGTNPECTDSNPFSCGSGQVCFNGECEQCPDLNIDYCWGIGGCSDGKDCVMEITITSDIPVIVDILLLANFNSVPASSSNAVEIGPTGYEFEFSLIDDPCIVTTLILNISHPTCNFADYYFNGSEGFICCADGCQHSACPGFTGENDELSKRQNQKNDSEPMANSIQYEVTKSDITTLFDLFPNPFNNKVEMVLGDVEEKFIGELIITDYLGRVVREETLNVQKGENKFTFSEMQNLNPGVYVVLIKKDGLVYASKNMVRME